VFVCVRARVFSPSHNRRSTIQKPILSPYITSKATSSLLLFPSPLTLAPSPIHPHPSSYPPNSLSLPRLSLSLSHDSQGKTRAANARLSTLAQDLERENTAYRPKYPSPAERHSFDLDSYASPRTSHMEYHRYRDCECGCVDQWVALECACVCVFVWLNVGVW